MRLRDEEGLDERGEAPPPYIKEPDRVHVREDHESVELQNSGESRTRREQAGTGKPPDYEERNLGGRIGSGDVTRPP